MKTKSIRIIFKLFLVLFSVHLVFFSNNLFANPDKDVILILDTSLSMVGYGGKNILNRVKSSISTYIDKLDDGDRVTFVTFDTGVRVFPTIYLDDDNDRDILKKYISMTEAKGKWTNTYEMIRTAFKKVEELDIEDDDTQKMIVVMTDGIDDPPPGYRRNRFNVNKKLNKYSNKDWWIFFVDLSESANDKKINALKNELSKVSKHTKIIHSGKKGSKGFNAELEKDVARLESESSSIIFPLFLVILVIAGLAGILYYFKKYSELKVYGKLDYWSNEVLDPYIINYDMGKRNLKEIVIGKTFECTLNIRELDSSKKFKIVAVRKDNEIKLEIDPSPGCNIEFINRANSEFLENGDIFKLKNYTFKFVV